MCSASLMLDAGSRDAALLHAVRHDDSTIARPFRQRGVELPLVISDHSDWDELCATIREVSPREVWVTHGSEEAPVRWCELQGLPAKPLHLMGYEEEPE